MKNLLFILNPQAGQRKANRYLAEILRMFIEYGYRCETYVTGAAGRPPGTLRSTRTSRIWWSAPAATVR